MIYFEELVTNGEWEEVEKYLSGFSKNGDIYFWTRIFLEIRTQKYLEALDKNDRAKAVDILMKDLKVFSSFNEDVFKELTLLFGLENFRQNEQLAKYGDTKSARGRLFIELKKLIEGNYLFRDKLIFPVLKNSRLRALINQSLNWQHKLCKAPKPNPDINTLFVDHSCEPSQLNAALVPSHVTDQIMVEIRKAAGFPPSGAYGSFPLGLATIPTSLSGLMANSSPVPHPFASSGPIGFSHAKNTASLLRLPMTSTNNPTLDYQTSNSEQVLKRARPLVISDEVSNLPANVSTDDLPKAVAMTLNQGSEVKNMDFHPVQQTLLLVGSSTGDISVWELRSRERLVHSSFEVGDLKACSMALQASLSNDYTASINRVIWSPDGTQFGVAYSKHIVHVYSYPGCVELRNPLEIEAHVGSVNDIAFSYPPNEQLCVVTCGDDKLIKVWDAVTGVKQYTFEGHKASVYSVYPHCKENTRVIFSAGLDGKIKKWLYDTMGSIVDYDAPGRSTINMAYNADGTRLFLCGTNSNGFSCMVEWNESKGKVKRRYSGLGKQYERPTGVVQFDTTRNRFLAVGDASLIKFWDMDQVKVMSTTGAEGGLSDSPRIRFNKEGILLAVSSSENNIKILANADGMKLLRPMDNRSFDASRPASAAVVKAPTTGTYIAANASVGSSITDRVTPMASTHSLNGGNRSLPVVNPGIVDESLNNSRIWNLTEINEQSQCHSVRLPDNLSSERVSRLMYTNSGLSILALATNAVHKLWKWQTNDQNPSGMATASVVPELWQPSSGILMTNDISDTISEVDVSCFALSKNDSYVMSASGGKISLFNMMTFKTMATFMPPPPAATFLAFHPQDNNASVIGMDDSSIQIYDIRLDKLTVWSTDGWEKQTSKYLQIPAGRAAATRADTLVQFHQNQTHLLAVHETQISIYEAPRLDSLEQWVPPEGNGPITHATYSCDSQSIYVSFEDGSVGIFFASPLRLRCRIHSASYLSAIPSSKIYPVVVAAHPSEANQIALGLTDGSIYILEPLESQGQWGTLQPFENGAGSSNTPGTPNTRSSIKVADSKS